MRKETYKSVGKKVLASALSAAMVVAFAPAASVSVVGAAASDAVAFADEGNADFTVSTAAELAAAVNQASDGQRISLSSDISLNAILHISKKLILDLGDNFIRYNATDSNARALMLDDGADVVINAHNGGVTTGTIALQVNGGAKLTVNGGTFAASYAVASFSSSDKKAEVAINGGVFNGWLYTNGTGHDDHFTINDGFFNKQLYFASGDRSTYKIAGGIFSTGDETAIEIDGGSLDITGGEFTCSADTGGNVSRPATNNNGSGAYNGVVVVCKPDGSNKTGYIGDAVVNITGGVFKHTDPNAEAIVVADFGSEDTTKGAGDAKVTIGGDADVTGKTVLYKSEGNTGASLLVKDGTFSDFSILDYTDASSDITVRPQTNLVLSKSAEIKNGETVTVDLGEGKTISKADRPFELLHGKLSFVGKGTVYESANDQYGAVMVYGSTNQSDADYSELTVGKDITLRGWSGIFIDQRNGKAYGAKVFLDGKAMSPGMDSHTTLNGCGIYLNGQVVDSINCPEITVGKNAEVISSGEAIYAAGYGKWDIAGKVSGGESGMEIRAGKLNITGGEFESTAQSFSCGPNGNGSTTVGAALAIAQHTTKKDISVTISDGKFKGVKALNESNPQKNDPTPQVKLSVKGGLFDGDVTVADTQKFISAGAFSSDPDNSYKAAGTETHLSPNDGMYHVHAQNADVRSDSAKAPTCTEPGYTAGSYCGIDGYQYSNGSTIPALGHEAGEYVVTTPATETTEGIATSTCTRCGEVLGTKTIEKLKPAGTEESGTSDTGEKVDVTVSDNTPGKTESGTEYVGSVEFNGSDSGSTGQPSSEANIPETVEVNGSTYVVTKIADEAFKDQEQLKSISIPATVIEVGKSAFEGAGVQSIVIPAATSSIGASAFKGCADLKTIDIQSAALKEIPASAFEGCASLQTANVPATIEKVGVKAFAGTAISDVILPEATTEVGASAFKDCESLKTVEFKGGVTAISNSLFQGAKALETIELPTSVTTIGKSAFEGTALKSLALPAAVKTVGSKAFASTPITSIVPAAKTTMAVAASGDGTLVLPAGLTTLGTSAFAGCASLKAATLPAKIKALATSTFSGCTALKSVDISGVATIGKSTFAGDKALKSLKTGTKLTTIGSSALSGAKALKTLSVSTKKLTKKGVKSSLKGSSVKTVKVKASKSKKTNKKYIAKYKKYFAKKNSGKKVTVK